MKSLRSALAKSWFPDMRLVSGDLAIALQRPWPLSLVDLVRFLDQPETRTFSTNLDADALHGATTLTIASDGSYRFSGHLRATGAPSFAYKLQAVVSSASQGVQLVIETSGRCYGTDTPGDRERSWDETGTSDVLRTWWTALRLDARLDTNLDKNLAGVFGTLVDVVETVVATYVGAQFQGLVGAVIVLGAELGAKSGVAFIHPNLLAGITVGAGVLLVFGPAAIIPAVAAGTATTLLADVRARRMSDAEIALARSVFADQLPIDRIWITDLSRGGDNGIHREFCIPGLDGSILVNMGPNYDHTLEPDVQGRLRYATPGEVFVHELTHAWQIHHADFLPGLMCEALTGTHNYDADPAKIAAHDGWHSGYGLEEQATIVDGWFGLAQPAGLTSSAALNDPRYWYLQRNIRTGRSTDG